MLVEAAENSDRQALAPVRGRSSGDEATETFQAKAIPRHHPLPVPYFLLSALHGYLESKLQYCAPPT